MAYSSHCFFFVSVALLLQFLIAPASALPLQSTQYIDDLCKMPSIDDKTFCLQTLTGYQGAMYAGSSITLAQIVISGLLVPHVQKTMRFALLTSAKEPPSIKTQFMTSREYLRTVGYSLAKAFDQLAVSPRSSTQDVMSCTDQITKVLNLIGKNQDVASKTLIEMTMRMKKLLPLGVAAAQAVAG
ncbi:hypothetical protein CARUB_v10028166mg [Capsella rubella]|uniref:Pectinesterase inhibitor domain-containing protein n=1 Tax=Capsella rubella TaxID=81985 RepID=R0F0R0_9BRAS|nr:uncharacterized protein LOC17876562 isoform X1 [Capsella rubella]EOA14851.1 hypothetical protein CARUB_v10028166mg [Capsella rubella]